RWQLVVDQVVTQAVARFEIAEEKTHRVGRSKAALRHAEQSCRGRTIRQTAPKFAFGHGKPTGCDSSQESSLPEHPVPAGGLRQLAMVIDPRTDVLTR